MAAESRVSMKPFIDTKGKRVLYAEAGKDFVDFLFHILSLPVGTLIRLLRKQENIGSLTNLYESIENLSDSYIQPNQKKGVVLNPAPPVSSCRVPYLDLTHQSPARGGFYKCSNNCYSYVSDSPKANCPHCQRKMTSEMTYVATPRPTMPDEGGFVKGGVVATYMVTDDLVVMPLSTSSIITLLQKFRIKELGDLEEKVVNFGMDEAEKLVNASMQTKKVLTHVFLKCTNPESIDVKTGQKPARDTPVLQHDGSEQNNQQIRAVEEPTPQRQPNAQRTLHDYIVPLLDGFQSSIVAPPIAANNVEFKPVLFTMLQNVGLFSGLAHEDPHQHLVNFLEICDSYKQDGVSPKALQMRLFKYSLHGAAREWLQSSPPNYFATWEDLRKKFMRAFYSPAKTDRKRKEIHNFLQQDGEELFEAWERFQRLLRQCPNHGFQEWYLMVLFYNSLIDSARMVVDSAAGGTFMMLTYDDSRALMDRIAENKCKRSERTLQAFAMMMPQTTQANYVIATPAAPLLCVVCGGDHVTNQCIATETESANSCIDNVGRGQPHVK